MKYNNRYFSISFLGILFFSIFCVIGYGQETNEEDLLNPQIPMFGIWKTDTLEDKITMQVFDAQNFRWNGQIGQYSILNDSIWFLNQDKTGTKWNLEIKSGNLFLRNPEDFSYLGNGNYLYFQFTKPDKTIKFRQEFEYNKEYITDYFECGNKKISIQFSEKNTGIQSHWYLKGKKEVEINFRDGKLHGKYTTFSKVGEIVKTVIYESGELID